jgi:hypothetical protein
VLVSELHKSKALQQALQHPQKFRSEMPPDSVFQVIWDSGASITISHEKADFHNTLKPFTSKMKLKGVSEGVSIEGQGTVTWNIMDTTGSFRTLKVPALYVPKAHVRLLSTANLLQVYKGEQIQLTEHNLLLSGIPNSDDRNAIHVHVNPKNNLPTSLAYAFNGIEAVVAAFTG